MKSMNSKYKKVINLFTRYIIIILAGLGNLYLFYKFLTPLTVKSVSLVTSIFSEVVVRGTTIYTRHATIEIVPACVAGAAFYLLFLLVLSTPNIKPKKRIKILGIAFLMLFILNILRITFLILIARTSYFDITHWLLWHIISTVLVVGTWLALVKYFKIREIPVYSDFKYLLKLSKKGKNT